MQELNNLIAVLVSNAYKINILDLSEAQQRKYFMQSWDLIRRAELFLQEQGVLAPWKEKMIKEEAEAPRENNCVDAWWIGTARGGLKLLEHYEGCWRIAERIDGDAPVGWIGDDDLSALRQHVEERWGPSWGWPEPKTQREPAAASSEAIGESRGFRDLAADETSRVVAEFNEAQEKAAAEIGRLKVEIEELKVALNQTGEKAAALALGRTAALADYQRLEESFGYLQRDYQTALNSLVASGTEIMVTHGRIIPTQGPGYLLDGHNVARVEIAAGRVLKTRMEVAAGLPTPEQFQAQKIELAKPPFNPQAAADACVTMVKKILDDSAGTIREQAAEVAERNATELFRTIEAQLKPFAMAHDDVKSKCRAMAEQTAKEVVDLCLAGE